MKKLPKTEFEIMKFIWGKNEKLPTKEIGAYMELLLGWKLSTTSKTLSRLVDKGFLTTERIGKQVFYTAIIKEYDYVKWLHKAAADCLREHVNNEEIRYRLYNSELDESRFKEQLANIIRPSYDSALNMGFRVWNYE